MKSVSINSPRFGVVEYHVKNDHIHISEASWRKFIMELLINTKPKQSAIQVT